MACDVESMGPFQGGPATYFGRGGQVSSGGAHKCALEAGHDGPHAKRTLTPLSDSVAMRTTYLWNDEHTLTAQVEFVQIETSRKLVEPSGGNGTAANLRVSV